MQQPEVSPRAVYIAVAGDEESSVTEPRGNGSSAQHYVVSVAEASTCLHAAAVDEAAYSDISAGEPGDSFEELGALSRYYSLLSTLEAEYTLEYTYRRGAASDSTEELYELLSPRLLAYDSVVF